MRISLCDSRECKQKRRRLTTTSFIAPEMLICAVYQSISISISINCVIKIIDSSILPSKLSRVAGSTNLPSKPNSFLHWTILNSMNCNGSRLNWYCVSENDNEIDAWTVCLERKTDLSHWGVYSHVVGFCSFALCAMCIHFQGLLATRPIWISLLGR